MDYCIMKTDFGFVDAFWGKAKRLKGEGPEGQDLWGYEGCPQMRGIGEENHTFMAAFSAEDYNWHRKLQFGKWHKHPTEGYSIKRFKDVHEFLDEVQLQLNKILEGAKNLKNDEGSKYLVIVDPNTGNPVSFVSNLQEDETTQLSDVHYDVHNRGVEHNLILKSERDQMFFDDDGSYRGGTRADTIKVLYGLTVEIYTYIMLDCGFIPEDIINSLTIN